MKNQSIQNQIYILYWGGGRNLSAENSKPQQTQPVTPASEGKLFEEEESFTFTWLKPFQAACMEQRGSLGNALFSARPKQTHSASPSFHTSIP